MNTLKTPPVSSPLASLKINHTAIRVPLGENPSASTQRCKVTLWLVTGKAEVIPGARKVICRHVFDRVGRSQ